MDDSDKYFLGQNWYPYYNMSNGEKAGPSAYNASGAISSCEQNCEQYANQVDFNQEAFFHFNECVNTCPDLYRAKTQYGPKRAL